MNFARELREGVQSGQITVSVRLWQRSQVRVGGRYRVGEATIEVDAIELVPFSSIGRVDVRLSGEIDRESLRRRAAHAGPIEEETLVRRIEFHAL